jgi:hypothetical protein
MPKRNTGVGTCTFAGSLRTGFAWFAPWVPPSNWIEPERSGEGFGRQGSDGKDAWNREYRKAFGVEVNQIPAGLKSVSRQCLGAGDRGEESAGWVKGRSGEL